MLRNVQLSGALFFVVEATSPWGVDVPHASAFASIILPHARHVISYHVITRGSGWAGVLGEQQIAFDAGDILVFPHGDAYSIVSGPDDHRDLDVDSALDFFRAMASGRMPVVVTEGGGGPESAQFVCGFLGCDARPFNPLLATLPRLLHVRRADAANGDLLDRLVQLTLAEADAQRAGAACIRLRLAELMFIELLRRHLEALPPEQTGWLAGLRDAVVGRALQHLHERPAHGWTLESLAHDVGVSRSVLAERFAHFVGCGPMQYLTHWRIQIAARRLTDRGAKVAAVAYEVGYASEAAFSRTFKKIAGVSPAAWRDGSTAAQ